MNKYLKYFINVFSLLPLMVFWHYIFLNVKNVGGEGVGLPALMAFLIISSTIVFFKYVRSGVSLKINFLLFLVLILWVAIRFIADFQGLHELKAHTIATTGGMMLFYLIGVLIREVLNIQSIDRRCEFLFYGLFYLTYVSWILFNFSDRISGDIFLLEDLDGAYQRAGNYMSMSFVVLSFLYVLSVINFESAAKQTFYFIGSTSIYFSCAVLLLLESQLIGSNSATLIVLGMSFLSISMTLLLSNKKIHNLYRKKTGRIFEFKNVLLAVVGKFILGVVFFLMFLMLANFYIDLDVTKIRVFGFGEGENSSLNSRFEILTHWGLAQLTYGPLFGNVNVAYLVTGDAGLTLHNFFLDVQASLGLIGSAIVSLIFILVFKSLYKSAIKKYNKASLDGFINSSIAFYSILVILFILVFANISSGFSWPVIWFVVGFLSNSFAASSQIFRINRLK